MFIFMHTPAMHYSLLLLNGQIEKFELKSMYKKYLALYKLSLPVPMAVVQFVPYLPADNCVQYTFKVVNFVHCTRPSVMYCSDNTIKASSYYAI